MVLESTPSEVFILKVLRVRKNRLDLCLSISVDSKKVTCDGGEKATLFGTIHTVVRGMRGGDSHETLTYQLMIETGQIRA